MTDGEFLTQTIIERMDLIFRRSNKEPSEEERQSGRNGTHSSGASLTASRKMTGNC